MTTTITGGEHVQHQAGRSCAGVRRACGHAQQQGERDQKTAGPEKRSLRIGQGEHGREQPDEDQVKDATSRAAHRVHQELDQKEHQRAAPAPRATPWSLCPRRWSRARRRKSRCPREARGGAEPSASAERAQAQPRLDELVPAGPAVLWGRRGLCLRSAQAIHPRRRSARHERVPEAPALGAGAARSRLRTRSSSASCTAFVAAPLRRLSPTIQRFRQRSCEGSSRMRPTSTSSRPAASSASG